jgi:hypothetical protein
MTKATMRKLQVKEIMAVFCNIRGIIMTDWISEGKIVNQNYYMKVLNEL